ncbi:MAG: hypothetical protein J6L00_02115, partial [Clostridia bacterium]|nr:hypothetical protein [Clostridia bacterium]
RINTDDHIQFYCTPKGKIIITDPPTRRNRDSNSTNLYGEIVQRDGKTYVTYYTVFDRSNQILKLVFLAIYILFVIVAIVLSFIEAASPVFLLFGLALLAFQTFTVFKEKESSPQDSAILVRELENRVTAVNRWDE